MLAAYSLLLFHVHVSREGSSRTGKMSIGSFEPDESSLSVKIIWAILDLILKFATAYKKNDNTISINKTTSGTT